MSSPARANLWSIHDSQDIESGPLGSGDGVPVAGFLGLWKEPGYTSNDVVQIVRRMLGGVKAGHAGTLDPAATGVLVVCIGRATRLASLVAEGRKEYAATVVFGVRTETDDAEGRVLSRCQVDDPGVQAFQALLKKFVGPIEQVPPAYSAISVGGQRAYRLARAGSSVALAPRTVTVYEIDLVEWRPPVAHLRIQCSKGTYIRALARDLGDELGCGAHLSSLTRTTVDGFCAENCVTLPELSQAVKEGRWIRLVTPLDSVLHQYPSVVLSEGRAEAFRHGRAVPCLPRDRHLSSSSSMARVYSSQGIFLGLARFEPEKGLWHPRMVF